MPQQQISRNDKVVHVRPPNVPVEIHTALERFVELSPGTKLSAFDAVFRKSVAGISGSEPQGFVGSGAVPGADCHLDKQLEVDGPLTVTQLLDHVSVSVPGVVWVVTYEPDHPLQTLRIGVVCPDGTFLKTSVLQ